jgi:acylphosphatase
MSKPYLSAMLQTYSILVIGKVQGVFYRQSTQEKAKELGITGMVKNLPDGNVQIMATGTTDQLNELVNWCKQGPPRAVVTSVKVEKLTAHAYSNFSIQR